MTNIILHYSGFTAIPLLFTVTYRVQSVAVQRRLGRRFSRIKPLNGAILINMQGVSQCSQTILHFKKLKWELPGLSQFKGYDLICPF